MEVWNDLKLTVGSQPKPALAKLRNLLNTPKFCTICYEAEGPLQVLEDCPLIEELNECQLNLREIIEELFEDAGSRIILSNYMCSICQVKLVYTYAFIQTTQHRANNYEYYLTQLDSETVDLLNCMQDNPSCANAIIVLQEDDPAEHKLQKLEKFKWSSNTAPVKEVTNSFGLVGRQSTTKMYTCDYCNTEFCDNKFLKAHLRLCKSMVSTWQQQLHSNSIYCPKCSKRPCQHEKFIKHFVEQKNKKCMKIRCLECSYSSNTLRPLIDHIDKKHMDELADNCELCGKMFHMREQYFSHFDTFHREHHVCSYCSSVIPKEHYSSHVIECMGIEKSHSCDKCPSKFETKNQALTHSLKHVDVPKQPKKKIVLKRCYSCPLCPEKFNGKLKLQKHCTNIHGVESYRNNHCQFCDIKFDDKKSYLLHMREMEHMADIDPNRGYRHKCEHCDYTARYSFILKTHVNRYHLKVTPFQCDTCNKKFLDKRKLRAHIDRHMGLGKRQCDICGDTLGSTTALVKHRRLHTGERPYPCHLCSVSLNSASERNFHILRKHTDKTHPCPLCATMFHTPYFVRRHIQQVHWKRKEKFDHTKLEGLTPEHYDLFRDRRMVEFMKI